MSVTQQVPLPRRNRLLATCAVAAIATVTVSMPLRAQTLAPGGFQGSHVVVNGTADVTQSGTNTLVQINAPRAIINWTANDAASGGGAINFLPQGRSVDFVNGDRSGNYIVLNRIGAADPNRPIALNGTVRSTLSTFAGGAQGGQVWFYAPSGLLIGSTAQINVGSLLLTANNVTDDDFLDGDSSFSFSRANSNASVVIEGPDSEGPSGARISAISRDSYVAIVAPRIVQAGSVRVNGSAAYVAAEQVDMTISGSLFDIAVQVGSDAAAPGGNTVEHSGQTTLTNTLDETGYGPSPQGPREAIMIAVPKNDAVTMLVSGGIAYQQAADAVVVDGKIILSAGYNVSGGAIGTVAPVDDPADTAKVVIGSIVAGEADGRSLQSMDLVARATDTAAIGTPASSRFGGDVTLRGARGANVTATGTGQSIQIAGNLTVDSSGFEDAGAQKASLIAENGGTITVGGNVAVQANATGGTSLVNSRTAEMIANNGTIQVNGAVNISADGTVGSRLVLGAVNATGGTAQIQKTGTGSITVGNTTTVSASAVGRNGGSGTGGTASVTSAGGLSLANGVTVLATGTGGRGLNGGPSEVGSTSATDGGAGRGGTASVTVSGDNALGGVGISATGRGGAGGDSPTSFGNPGAGGVGDGGTASFTATSGTNTLNGLIVNSSESGGDGGFAIVDGEEVAGNSAGGATTGDGRAVVTITGGSVILDGNIQVLANAFGGDGGASGGQARAGTAIVDVSGGGTLNAPFSFQVRAIAEGGTGPFNGPATGGTATVRSGMDGTIDASGTIQAAAFADSLANDGELQLDLRGGTALVEAVGGVISANSIHAIAWAENQATANAQDVVGGSATIRSAEDGAIVAQDQIYADASAFGFQGGRGIGGTVLIEADKATMRAGTAIDASADGNGRTSGPAGAAALATAGTITLRAANGGSIADTVGGTGNLSLVLTANGEGEGGDGVGGIIVAEAISGGSLSFGNLVLFDAVGNGIGSNFTGTGGEATLRASGGGAVNIVSTQLTHFNLSGSGTDAVGGKANIIADNGTIAVSSREVLISLIADGGAGGVGRGGDALLRTLNSGAITVNSNLSVSLTVDVRGSASGARTANGGDGRGGTITVEALSGAISSDKIVTLLAGGTGMSTDARGGAGIGGAIAVGALGGDVTLGTEVVLDVTGTGGTGSLGGGSGTGGAALVQTALGSSLTAGNLSIDAGGTGQGGAGGTGGTARIVSDGGLDLGDLTLSAAGVGGRGLNASPSETGYGTTAATAGGVGQGGEATIDLGGTSNLGAVQVSAGGLGGSGGDTEPDFGPAGTGGAGIGGTARLSVNSGASNLVDLSIRSNGTGGEGGGILDDGRAISATGGAGRGGIAELQLAFNSEASLRTGHLVVRADGDGGVGRTGGAGTGGRIDLNIGGSTLLEVSGEGTDPTIFSATGTGADGTSGAGGAGVGGQIQGGGGGRFNAFDDLQIRAEAFGGDSVTGVGGSATTSVNDPMTAGPDSGIRLTFFDGGLRVGDSEVEAPREFVLSSLSVGGTSRDGDGGSATSGEARAEFASGTSVFSGNVTVDARAQAGDGKPSGSLAQGGAAFIEVGGGSVTFERGLTIDATAVNAPDPSRAFEGVTLLRSRSSTVTVARDVTMRGSAQVRAEFEGSLAIGDFETGYGNLTISDGEFVQFTSDSQNSIRVGGAVDVAADRVLFRTDSAGGGDPSIIGGLLARTIDVVAGTEISISGMSLRTPIVENRATGSIRLTAPSIVAASPQAMADLTDIGTTEERSARLGQNDGSVDLHGYLSAADVTLTASDKVWIQNTGASEAPDDRAGIRVGPNTLSIVTDDADQPVELIINAREEQGGGGFTTGQAMLDEVELTGPDGTPANVAEGSTLNGCDIGTGECVGGPPPPPPVITGFLGTPTIGGGTATVSDDHSFITISSPRAIINWSDAQTDFLPTGNFAEFSGISDYIVLNRVLPTDMSQAIQLNGRIDSFVNGVAGRGKIWFYSPSGILVGSTARINVGSLLLSASNLADDDFLDGNNSFSFGRDDSLASVSIAQGAQINARDPNAYLALLAPRVRQSGELSVSGGAAYVAAEDATLTINGALFDISASAGTGVIGTGTDDAALVHDGSTTLTDNPESGYGPSPAQRQAVMVAVPKNQAITMLVSGRVEFPSAEAATQVGSSIVLSGGRNVSAGNITGPAGGTGPVNIAIGNNAPDGAVAQTVFGRDLFVQTSGTITANAVNTNTIDPDLGVRRPDLILSGPAILRSTAGVTVRASDGGSILASDGLLLDASGTLAAGQTRLVAETGTNILVQGTTDLRADLSAGHGDTIVSTGLAEIAAEGGAINLLGDTRLGATISGGSVAGSTAVNRGQVTAGVARVTTSGAGTLAVGSVTQSADLIVSATANGTRLGGAGQGGNAVGGTAAIEQAGSGSVAVFGRAILSTTGDGGVGSQSGAGTGGTSKLVANGGSVSVAGATIISAAGLADGALGNFGVAGSATGGTALVEATAGTITLNGPTALGAGASASFGGGLGGSATGGSATLRTGPTGTINAQQVSLRTAAAGGSSDRGPGGIGSGGTIRVDVGAGRIDIGYGLSIDGGNRSGGGAVGDGAASTGGSVTISLASGGVLDVDGATELAADATGGGSSSGIGGAATGGTVNLSNAGGSATFNGSLTLRSLGQGGGSATAGGLGTGGQIIVASNGGSVGVTGDLVVDAGGTGGFGTTTGGNGAGGLAQLNVTGSQVEVGGFVELLSGGEGGDSGNRHGDGQGGTSRLVIAPAGSTAGRLASLDVFLDASGNGGNARVPALAALADTPGTGGAGTGGTAEAIVNGTLDSEFLTVRADGEGGRGRDGVDGDAADGSAGQGGTATVDFQSGTNSLTSLIVSADGIGGNVGFFSGATEAGDGGSGTGGTASLGSTGGSVSVSETFELSSAGQGGDGAPGSDGGDASGGSGGSGGDGAGGTINLGVSNGGAITLPASRFDATGRGGLGSSGGSGLPGGDGGAGGAGTGGTINVNTTQGALTIVSETEGSGGATFFAGPEFDARGLGNEGGYGGDGLFGGAAGNSGAGGNATGGTINLTANGTALTFGAVTMNAEAVAARGGAAGSGGASGTGGIGGSATGGTVNLTFSGTTTLNLEQPQFDIDVDASGGTGGAGGTGTNSIGLSGSGGQATGGTATLQFNADQTQLAALSVSATGRGGLGGTGREVGYGSPGFGGTTAAGAAGGDATGGTIVLSSNAGRLTHNGDILLSAGAVGGGGAFATDLAGGRGGDAVGGSVTVSAAGTGTIASTGMLLTAQASGNDGGGGGNGAVGGAGGRGGDATGGRVTLSTSDSGRIEVTGSTTALTRAFGGFGGQGGNGSSVGNTGGVGGDAGLGQGGRAEIVITGGTAQLNQVSFNSNGNGGAGGLGGTGAGRAAIPDNPATPGVDESAPAVDPTIADGGLAGRGIGGAVDIAIADGAGGEAGRLTAGNVFLNANGLDIDELPDVAGSISISETAAAAEDTLVFANLVASALGANGESGTGFSFTTNGGRTRITGGLFVETDADASFSSTNNGRIDAAGDIELTIDRTLSLNQNAAPSEAILNGNDLLITLGALNGDGALLLARRDLTIDATGNVSLANLSAGDDARITAGGNVLTSGVTLGTAADLEEDGSNIVIQAGSIGNPSSTSFLSAANNISLTASANIDVTGVTALGGDVRASGDSITIQTTSASNDVLMTGGSSISLSDVSAGRDVRLSGGNVVVGTGTAGRLFLVGGIDLTLANVSSNGSEPDEDGLTGLIVEAEGAVDITTGSSASTVSISGSSVGADTLTAGTSLRVNSTGATTIGTAQAGTSATLTGIDSIDVALLSAGTDARIDSADGAALLGTINAGRDLTVDADDIVLTSGTAGRDILLRADNGLNVSFARAGDDFTGISFGGTVNATRIETTGLGEDVSETGYGDGSNLRLAGVGDVRLDNADVVGGIQLDASEGSVRSAGLIEAGLIDVRAANDITLNDLTIVEDITLNASNGLISGDTFVSTTDSIDLSAGNGVTLTSATANDFIDIEAASGGIRLNSGNSTNSIRLSANAGDIDVGTLAASLDILISALDGAVDAASLSANRDLSVDASGNVDLGTARAFDDVRVRAGGILTAANLVADGSFDAGEIGAPGRTVDVAGTGGVLVTNATAENVIAVSPEGDVRVDNAAATGVVQLTANQGSVFSSGRIDAQQLSASAGDNIALNDVTTDADIVLSASTGSISGNVFTSEGAIDLTAGNGVSLASASADSIDLEGGTGGISLGNGSASDFIALFAQAGNISAGTLTAGSDIVAQTLDGAVAATGLTAGRDIVVRASDTVDLGAAIAGDDLFVRAGGIATIASATVSGLGDDSGEVGYGDGSNIDVGGATAVVLTSATAADGISASSANGDVRLDNGQAGGLVQLSAAEGDILSSGLITAQQLNASAGSDIALNDVTTVADIALRTSNGAISGRTFTTDGRVDLTAANGVTLTSADAGAIDIEGGYGGVVLTNGTANTFIALFANAGNIRAGTLSAGGDILAQTLNGAAAATSLTAGRDIQVRATGNLDLASSTAGDDLFLRAGGFATIGTLTATGLGPDTGDIGSGNGSSIDLSAGGASVTSADSAGSIVLAGTNVLNVSSARSGTSLRLNSSGPLTAATLTAGTTLNFNSSGDVTIASATSGTSLDGNASGVLRLANGLAGTSLRLNASGALLGNEWRAGTNVNLNSSREMSVATVAAGTSVNFNSSRDVIIGSITAATSLTGNSSGSTELANVTVGSDGALNASGDLRVDAIITGASLRLTSSSDVVVGSATAGTNLQASAGGSMSGNSIQGGLGVALAGRDDVTVTSADAGEDLVLSSGSGDVRLDDGAAGGAIRFGASEGSANSNGLLQAASLDVQVGNDIALNDVTVTSDLVLNATSGSVIGDDFRTDGNMAITGGGLVDVSSLVSGGAVELTSTRGSAEIGAASAGTSFAARADAGSVSIGNGEAGSFLDIAAGGAVNATTLMAGTELSIGGGSINLNSGVAGDDIGLASRGAVTVTSLQAGDDVVVDAAGAFSGGNVTTTGQGFDDESGLRLLSAGSGLNGGTGNNVLIRGASITLTDATAIDKIELEATSGSLTSTGTLTAGDDIEGSAAAGVMIARASAGGEISLRGSGLVQAQDLTSARDLFVRSTGNDVVIDTARAGIAAFLTAAGSLEAQNLTVGSLNGSAGLAANVVNVTAGRDVRVTAGGVLSLTNATAGEDIRLTGSTVNVGFAQAGDDFIARAQGGNFSATRIITTGLGPDEEAGSAGAAGSSLDVRSAGAIFLTDASVANRINLQAQGGAINSGGLITANFLLANALSSILLNDVTVASTLDLAATNGAISGDSFVSTGGSINLAARDGITLASANAATDLSLSASGAIALPSGTAGRDISVSASVPSGSTAARPDAQLGTLTAGRDIIVDAGAIPLGTATAGRDIRLSGSNGITLTSATAGDDFVANSGTGFAAGQITTTGLGADLPESGYGAGDGSNIQIAAANGPLSLANGNAANGIALSSQSGAITSTGLLAGRSLIAQAAESLVLNDVDVIDSLSLSATGGSISGDRFESDGSISLDARDDVMLAALQAASTLDVVAGRAITLGTAEAGSDMLLRTSATINGATEPLDAARTITATSLNAGGNLVADAAGTISLGTLTAGQSANVQSARSITVTTAQAGLDLGLTGVESIDVQQAVAGRDLELLTDVGNDTSRVAPRSVNVTSAQAGDDLVLSAFGTVQAGTLTTTGLGQDGTDLRQYPNLPGAGVLIISERGTSIDSIAATGDILIQNIAETRGSFRSDGSGGVDVETLQSGANIAIFNSNSGVTLGTAEAAGSFSSSSGSLGDQIGGFTAINLLANAGSITISAPGDVLLETGRAGTDINVTSGRLARLATTDADRNLTVRAATIELQQAEAGADALLEAADAITIASLTAGNLVKAQAGGAISADNLRTTTVLDDDGESGIVMTAGGDIDMASADSASLIRAEGSNVTATALTAAEGIELRGGTIEVATAQAGGAIELAADGGSLTAATLSAGGNIGATATTTANITNANAAGSFALTAGEVAELGTLVAGTDLTVNAGRIMLTSGTAGRDLNLASAGGIEVTSAQAGDDLIVSGSAVDADRLVTTGLGADPEDDDSDIRVTAAGAILLAQASAADDIDLRTSATEDASTETLDAARTINAATLSAGGSLQLDAAGAVALTTATAGGAVDVQSASILNVGAATGAAEVALAGAGNVVTGPVTGGSVRIASGGQLTTGNVTATTGTLMLSGAAGQMQTGALKSMASLSVTNASGAFAAGDLESFGGTVQLTSAGDIAIGNVRAAGSIFLTGGGLITAGNLTAGTGPLMGGGGMPGNGGNGGPGAAGPGIAPGFDDTAFPRNDDGATGAVPLPFGINYFGQAYEQLFVSNNGYITFNSGQGTFTPSGLAEGYNGQPIIAAFFADVDTRNSGSALMTYGTGSYAGRDSFGATWDGVGYFSGRADKLNNFQLILTNRADTGEGNFDIYFNYARISWETGSASGGSNGFGGVSAAVGYNAGTGNQPGTFFELPGSRVPGSFLDNGPLALVSGSNNGVPGQLFFQVRNGQVVPGGGSTGAGDIKVSNLAQGNSGNITLGALAGGNVEVLGANNVTTAAVNGTEAVSLSATEALTYASSQSGASTTLAGRIINGGATIAGGDLTATGGTITIDEARAGDDITIMADATALIGAVATTGAGTDGEQDGFRIDIEAADDVSLGTAEAAGDIRLVSREGGVLRIGAPAVPGANTLTAAGNVFVMAAEAIAFDAITAGEAIQLSSGASTTLGTGTAGTDLAMNGAAISLTSGTAGRDIRLTGSGDVTVGSARAGDDFIAMAGGAFTGTSVVTTGAGSDLEESNGSGVTALASNDGSNILVTAVGAVRLDNGDAKDVMSLTSQQAAITSAQLLKAGDAVTLTAPAGINVARIDSGGDTTLAAQNGAVLVSQDLKSARPVTASGRSVTLNALGALGVANATATAGNVALTSAGDLGVERATASDAVSATSGGLLTLGGSVDGAQISLVSRNIAIGNTAQVGSAARTGTVQITANGAGSPILIGGTAQPNETGYRLDNSEFSRITARELRITGQGENAMQIDALTVRGPGSGTSFNVRDTLTIANSGDVEVVGRLSFENASDSNIVRVSAGRDFIADTAGGGISVTGTGGSPAGQVQIEGRRIDIATRAALTDLDGAADVKARDERLGRNDGDPQEGGFVRAGAIRLTASERIFVQNSGPESLNPDDRAGLTAGAGGITLASRGSGPVEVIINGRQDSGQGDPILGKDLIAAIQTEGSQGLSFQFASGSTINGCAVTGSACGVPPPPPEILGDFVKEIEEEEEEEADDNLTRPPAIGFSRLISLEGSPFLGVIDEPVTGAGNEDLGGGSLGIDLGNPNGLPRDETVDQPVTGSGNEALQSGDTGPLIQLENRPTSPDAPDANGPATGTGIDDLQNGPDADGPVTGTGNEDLQDRPNR
jgi:filamentous hemagglutinin family protein